MLGTRYRYVAKNATGVATGTGDSITLTVRRWRFDSSGVREAEASEATLISGGASLANNGYLAGPGQDNTAVGTKWLGGDFLLTATVSTATPNGSIEIWEQQSTDGGTTWPDNGKGRLVKSLRFTATGTQKESFSL